MEYNFVSNENNFTINEFKTDLKQIEQSETVVWQLHKDQNIIGLFNEIKLRKEKVNFLVLVYNSLNVKFEKIQEEILNAFPEVDSVNFKSHFEKIKLVMIDLNNLVEKQRELLNITDNLINEINRENILNGDKKFDYESEFTSTIKELLRLIEDNEKVDNTKSTTNINYSNSDEKELKNKKQKSDEIENNAIIETMISPEDDEKVTNNLKLDENIDDIKVKENKVLAENINELKDNEEIQNESKSDVNFYINDIVEHLELNNESKDNNDNSYIENVKSDEPQNLDERNYENEELVSLNEIAPIEDEEVQENIEKIQEELNQKNEIETEEQEVESKEPTYEKLVEIIKKYFSYDDSPEINDEEKARILKNAIESRSALRYAKVIWELSKSGELQKVEDLAQRIYGNTLTDLYRYGIGIQSYSLSQSWAIWDVVKQFYYLKNPAQTDRTKYKLTNPLVDEEKQNEILDRHIGWEIYSKMTTGALDEFLSKFKDPIYRKRMVEFMIEKPNKNNTLPSYKLAELGKNVRLGFKDIN